MILFGIRTTQPSEIYEFLRVDAPLLSATAPVTPAALNLPAAAQRALEQHIARVYAMPSAAYWHTYRAADDVRRQQGALRTEAGRVLASGGGGGGGGQAEHSMKAYAPQLHIFRSVADEERIRSSNRRSNRVM